MHELSIMQGVFDIVLDNAEKHSLTKITKINIVVGEISGVEPEALDFAFSYFARGSIAEGAEFSITRVPLTGRCRRCGEKLQGLVNLECKCEGPPAYEMLTGTELYVNTIAGENEEDGYDEAD
ncbi:MAG: hydrogenase maturation nickel metallochaperone HypA [Desulfitobacterium hafniense]|nr:hydrogenase maturation nickel metallochaperone HypA [Desulfitobacterium hafniense]